MARLSAKPGPRGTQLGQLYQSGSLKLVFPRQTDLGLCGVLVNTAGGATGGDRFDVRAEVVADATLTLTTQAAERAYKAKGTDPARLNTRLRVRDGGTLHWLPQETILFEGCKAERSLDVDLAATGAALIAETLIFGRAAMGETLRNADFRDRILIRRAGRPILLEAAQYTGDVQAQLARRFTGNGAVAVTIVALAAPGAASALTTVRAMLPDTGGASAISDDLLILRLLAPDSHLLRQSLVPILTHLTKTDLPRPWMI
ncbi:MAG: urease accessory protein UreD [Tateyamaria sp.]